LFVARRLAAQPPLRGRCLIREIYSVFMSEDRELTPDQQPVRDDVAAETVDAEAVGDASPADSDAAWTESGLTEIPPDPESPQASRGS